MATLGERVRHVERVVVDRHGLADPAALVVEPINAGRCANAGDAGSDGTLRLSIAGRDLVTAQSDDFGWRDLLGASRLRYRHGRTALNLGLQAVGETPSPLAFWTAERANGAPPPDSLCCPRPRSRATLRLNESIHRNGPLLDGPAPVRRNSSDSQSDDFE